MRLTGRRVAMLLCSIALNGFFFLSPTASVELSAARCQQTVDAEFAACESACGNAYEFGSDDYQTCDNSCLYWWTEKSKHAITCNEDSCPDCDATWICDVPDPVVDPDVNCYIFF
jgi:hypothetical protein